MFISNRPFVVTSVILHGLAPSLSRVRMRRDSVGTACVGSARNVEGWSVGDAEHLRFGILREVPS